MTYIILDIKWWTPQTPTLVCIGIVAIKSYRNQWKCYIGYGNGVDEAADAQAIAAHGMPLGSKAGACGLFPQLDPEGYRS